MDNRCVSCGEIIPEGRMVCPNCEKIYETVGIRFVRSCDSKNNCEESKKVSVSMIDGHIDEKMTPQEAIEIIKIAIAEVEWNYPMEYAVAFENAISALENQIAKKPIETAPDGHSDYYCSACDAFLGDDSEIGADCLKPTYCPQCGQALDWSEEE